MAGTPQFIRKEARQLTGLLASVIKADWTQAASGLLDLIYPPRCAGCERIDHRWCPQCAEAIAALPWADLHHRPANVHDSASCGRHEGLLRNAVQALKYEQALWVAPILGQRMASLAREKAWRIDIVVPVPLFSVRQRERGYNQSQLLGEIVAQELALPLQAQAITRHRNTQSQVGLSAHERQNNVQNAFSAQPSIVNQQHILLIDDVFTTGATLSACAAALVEAGAAAVFSLTATAAQS